VRVQLGVRLADHRIADSVLTDLDHGVQVMTESAEMAALLPGQVLSQR